MPAGRDPLDPRDPRDLPTQPDAPGHVLEVAPTRVASPRSGRVAIGSLGVLVVLIAAAVVVAQVTPPPPGPGSAPPSGSAAPGVVARSSPTVGSGALPTKDAAEASAVPFRPVTAGPVSGRVASPRLSPALLRDRVRAGDIDEQLVFVDGALAVTPVPCQSLAQAGGGCVELAIPGLGLPVWAGSPAVPWRGDPPRGAWLVTVARAGGLVYLGALVPGAPVPDSLDQLTASLSVSDPGTPLGTVFELVAWLVPNPVSNCYRPGVAATPCPPAPPFLATDRPSDAGVLRTLRGAAVDLARPVVGVDRGANVVSGTFLVVPPAGCDPGEAAEACPDARWLVVARYDPAESVRVLVP